MQPVKTNGKAALYRHESYCGRTTPIVEWIVKVGAQTIRICTTRKEHRCYSCRRRIPAGVRCWRRQRSNGTIDHEHSNCEEFRHEPLIYERR